MTATEQYAALVDAALSQRTRLAGDRTRDQWAGSAKRFRYDPRRALDANLAVLALYVRPADVVIDVGGGAGRIGLPLALRCREVVNVEPSRAMLDEFEACKAESGIANARHIAAGWLDAGEVEGDIVIASHVTYFVREIALFLRKLHHAARRRALIIVASVPPPNDATALYRIVFGEPKAPLPGYAELLPVLWEMEILPEIHTLPAPFTGAGSLPQTHDEAVRRAIDSLEVAGEPRVRSAIEANFEALFKRTDRGFQPAWRPGGRRELLITWETSPHPG